MTVEPAPSSIAFETDAWTIAGFAVACFTFTNLDPRPLDRLVVRFEFRDADGGVLARMSLDRRGSFAPHVPIVGYTGSGPSLRMNPSRQCAMIDGGHMKFPSAALRAVVLVPTLLHFTDGTTVEPHPEPSPAPSPRS
jgi:hypothetical protein